MGQNFSTFAFTDSVKKAQTHYGSREQQARVEQQPNHFTISMNEAEFIQSRDGFYLSTTGDNGWPYMQFRGGPKGFLKILGPRTLGFADFRGNQQYISTGNVTGQKKALLFLVDLPTRQRLKIWATSEVRDVADEPELAAQLIEPDYPAKAERLFLFNIEGINWNCPKHITPRYSLEEIENEIKNGNPAFLERFQLSQK